MALTRSAASNIEPIGVCAGNRWGGGWAVEPFGHQSYICGGFTYTAGFARLVGTATTDGTKGAPAHRPQYSRGQTGMTPDTHQSREDSQSDTDAGRGSTDTERTGGGETTTDAGTVDDQPSDGTDGSGLSPFSRRSTLVTLLGLGGLGAASGSAQADPGKGKGSSRGGGRTWQTDVDGGGNALVNLGALEMADNPTAITDFEGEHLQIDDAGIVAVEDGPGSGLDADTVDGTDLADLEARIEANTAFVEHNASVVVNALSAIEEWINSDLESVESTLNSGLASIETTINDLGTGVESEFGTVATAIEDLLTFVSTGVVDGVNGVLGDVENAFDSVAGVINSVLDPLASAVESTFDDVDDALSAVESDVNGVIGTIESNLQGTINDIIDVTNIVINNLNGLLNPANGASGPIDNISNVSLGLGRIDVPDVGVSLPDASFSAPDLPEIPDPPGVDLPDISFAEVSLPRVDIPPLSLPKPTQDFEDFEP